MKRILIIDDNPKTTRTIRVGLDRTGRFKVREVNKGADAIPAIEAFKPDLVLLDLYMEDREGSDIAKEIRDKCKDGKLPQTQIAFLTALVEDDRIVKGDIYIGKPITISELITHLDAIIGK